MNGNNTELYHYGVKGMKWGVKKADYKTMSYTQRKTVRDKYRKTPEGKKKTKNARRALTAAGVVVAMSGFTMATILTADNMKKNRNAGAIYLRDQLKW